LALGYFIPISTLVVFEAFIHRGWIKFGKAGVLEKMVTMRIGWAANVAKPIHRNMFQGRNLMVSHLRADGGDFLPPQGTNIPPEPSKAWAADAMLYYKKTGCSRTREALVLYYMDTFVSRLAAKVSASVLGRVEPDDLKQSAFFALDRYIDRFDPARRFKFESFARLRIEGAMLDFLRREDPASRLARSRSKMIARGIATFKAQHGLQPTNEELRQLLQLDEAEFLAVMRDVHVPCTLSFHPSETDSSAEESTVIHIEAELDSFASTERKDLNAWLFQQLDHYDLLIVTLTYTEGLTMLEIGNMLGYSESRISQRLKHVHSILKTRLLDNPEALMLMAG
jgi:RNA polymerase sigma factor for flagellar operon FliA